MEKLDEKIEFDIIVGGKYKERVSRGVLIGVNGTGVKMARSGSTLDMVTSYLALKDSIENDEKCAKLLAEFEKFKESALPEVEKMLDELFAKVKKEG